jgi:hypothetical protein
LFPDLDRVGEHIIDAIKPRDKVASSGGGFPPADLSRPAGWK